MCAQETVISNKESSTSITTLTTRMFLEEAKVETLVKMVEEVEKAVRELSTAQVDVILLGCTSGSLLRGPEWDKQIVNRMEKTGQMPSITTSGPVVKALEEIGAREIAVATPYIDELSIRVKEFLEGYGFEITDIKGLGLSKGIEIGNQYPETAYDPARLAC